MAGGLVIFRALQITVPLPHSLWPAGPVGLPTTAEHGGHRHTVYLLTRRQNLCSLDSLLSEEETIAASSPTSSDRAEYLPTYLPQGTVTLGRSSFPAGCRGAHCTCGLWEWKTLLCHTQGVGDPSHGCLHSRPSLLSTAVPYCSVGSHGTPCSAHWPGRLASAPATSSGPAW